jgi:hypothetical protein
MFLILPSYWRTVSDNVLIGITFCKDGKGCCLPLASELADNEPVPHPLWNIKKT